jgi:hypothetical protein
VFARTGHTSENPIGARDSNRALFIQLKSLLSTCNTYLYYNSDIFTKFRYIILRKILLFRLSYDVELAFTI